MKRAIIGSVAVALGLLAMGIQPASSADWYQKFTGRKQSGSKNHSDQGQGSSQNSPFQWKNDHWERAKAKPNNGSQSSESPFVWKDGHWERRRAKKVVTVADPFPKDHDKHQPGWGNNPPPIVTNPIPTSGSQPIIRDHRKPKFNASGAPGGVTVTPTWGSRPIIRDHRTPDTSSAPGGVTVTSTSTSKPIIRDHRKPMFNASGSPGGVTVRNSTSSGPIIRDHRTSSRRPTSGSGGVKIKIVNPLDILPGF